VVADNRVVVENISRELLLLLVFRTDVCTKDWAKSRASLAAATGDLLLATAAAATAAKATAALEAISSLLLGVSESSCSPDSCSVGLVVVVTAVLVEELVFGSATSGAVVVLVEEAEVEVVSTRSWGDSGIVEVLLTSILCFSSSNDPDDEDDIGFALEWRKL